MSGTMTPAWTQVVSDCDKRIAELTAVCVSPSSTDQQIRNAQSGIEECNRLKSLPDRMTASAQQQGARSKRQEY